MDPWALQGVKNPRVNNIVGLSDTWAPTGSRPFNQSTGGRPPIHSPRRAQLSVTLVHFPDRPAGVGRLLPVPGLLAVDPTGFGRPDDAIKNVRASVG